MSLIARKVEPPPRDSLPSGRRLVAYAATALAVIATLVVTVVLPAERGVDPTGIGSAIGLTQMGRVKLLLAMDAADHEAEEAYTRLNDSLALVAPGADTAGSGRSDTTALKIAPGELVEIRLLMKGGARVSFQWTAHGAPVAAVMFADSLNSNPEARPGRPQELKRSDAGEFVAAFDGWHGVRWRNPHRDTVTLVIRTSGRYLSGRQAILDQP